MVALVEEILVEADDFLDFSVVVEDLLVVAPALVGCSGLDHLRHLLKNFGRLPRKLGLDIQSVVFEKPNVELLFFHAPLSTFDLEVLGLQEPRAGPEGLGLGGVVGVVDGGVGEVWEKGELETRTELVLGCFHA